jgi:putative NIF3 family GTP cyclohydrolase 1 type 2
LDQDIQDVAVLIDCTPEVMEAAIDLEEHLVEVPRVARPRRLV